MRQLHLGQSWISLNVVELPLECNVPVIVIAAGLTMVKLGLGQEKLIGCVNYNADGGFKPMLLLYSHWVHANIGSDVGPPSCPWSCLVPVKVLAWPGWLRSHWVQGSKASWSEFQCHRV